MSKGNEAARTRVVDWDTFLTILRVGDESAAKRVETEVGSCRGQSTTQVRLAFSRLGRQAGTDSLPSSDASRDLPGFESTAFFTIDLVARMAFLIGLQKDHSEAAFLELLTTLYRAGSQSEQVSVMRTLPWLPDPGRFVSLASEACRTNDVRVFAALCSDNPFPTQFLSDPALFQMVLKAMFLEVDTTHTLGLPARTNDELLRMVRDFAKEREAAGRTIPQDAQAMLAAS